MGSSNSSLGSRSSRPRPHRFIKRKLRSFICGSSSSSSSHVPIPEVDEYEVKLLPRSAEWHDTLVVDRLQRSKKDCSSIICLENECSCSTTETRALSDRSCSASEAPSVECSSRCAEIVHVGKCVSKSKDLVAEQLDTDYSANEPRLEIRGDICCSSSKGQCDIGCSSSGGHYSLHSEGVQVESSTDDVVRVGNSENVGGSEVCLESLCSSDTPCPELGDFCADGVLHSRNLTDSTMGVPNDESSSVPVVTDSSAMSVSTHGEITQVAAPSPPGYLLQDMQQDSRNGSILHVDVLSISSNVFFSSTEETNNRDMRRNSRRIFWDAFSRRGSRRHSDLQTIFLSSEDTDNLDSHDRWLLGFNDDTFEDMAGRDSGSLGSRSHNIYQGWRNSRSEIWERLHGGPEGSGQQASFCASGLHPYGTCSCEPYMMADDSGAHGSISRIVMLAEALFEVLDEIHRQPLSVSLSMVSLPAPESVVNSFPVKSLKKHSTAENGDEEQCYICLSEYEEGDKIRVLPCHHEYHMLCVDKWLKEIHGVCPLCRRDVCEGAVEGSVSNS